MTGKLKGTDSTLFYIMMACIAIDNKHFYAMQIN